MRIKLLFFGKIKDIFGCDSLWVKVPQNARAVDVVRMLSQEPRAAVLSELPLVYAVNEHYEPDVAPLREDDELALMTPMSGG